MANDFQDETKQICFLSTHQTTSVVSQTLESKIFSNIDVPNEKRKEEQTGQQARDVGEEHIDERH